MKTKTTLFLLIGIITLFLSCGKDEDKDDISKEEMTASVDGDPYLSDIATAKINAQDRLIITTTTTDSLRPYFIFDLYQKDKGIYLFATPEVVSAQYYPGFGVNELYYAVLGNIEITDHDSDAQRVKGTFDITFEEGSSGLRIDVRDGVFDVIYE